MMRTTTSRRNEGHKREAWTAQEDKILVGYIRAHGEGKWKNIPKQTGLRRCGKSCRLRWMNYLRPDIKRGNITEDEQDLILRLHKLLGNRWSLIAGRLPGRTDNEIKNYWNTSLAKKDQEKRSKHKPQNGKREIAESGVSRSQEASERVIPEPAESPSTQDQVVFDSFTPTKHMTDYYGDSDVATVQSVAVDGQSLSPVIRVEERVDGSLMDFDLGDVDFLEFLDLDFSGLTDFEMFDKNESKQEGRQSDNSPPLYLSAETTAASGNGNATGQ